MIKKNSCTYSMELLKTLWSVNNPLQIGGVLT